MTDKSKQYAVGDDTNAHAPGITIDSSAQGAGNGNGAAGRPADAEQDGFGRSLTANFARFLSGRGNGSLRRRDTTKSKAENEKVRPSEELSMDECGPRPPLPCSPRYLVPRAFGAFERS